jgi:hypothetical protein
MGSSSCAKMPGGQAGASCNLLYSNKKKLSEASCGVFFVERSEKEVSVVKMQSGVLGQQVSYCSACRGRREVMLCLLDSARWGFKACHFIVVAANSML